MSEGCGPDVQNRLTKIETEMIASERALKVALTEMNRRLEEMNQFRAQISEERAAFLTTKEYYVQHEVLRGQINTGELWRSNMDGRMWMLGAVMLFLNTAVAIGVGLVFHFWK